jgi:hypothetical protein
MSRDEFDFAVFGSTPLAQLLAGLLANTHGRKVLLAGTSQAGYRLARGIDLSTAPLTRPDTWAVLVHTLPEMIKLLTRISGRQAWSHVDPIFFAEGQVHGEALAHLRHMAQGFGIAADPVAPSLLGAGRQGVVLRDTIRINRPALEAGLDRWFERGGVTRASPQKVDIASDGRTQIISGGTAVEARQAVLADDEAIMAWLPLRQWPTHLTRRACASILTTPTRPLAASVMLDLNLNMVLTQQPEGGIAAFGPGDLADFSGQLQALLGKERQVEQAGQTGFQALVTNDGAPVVGRAGGVGADILAGLGSSGAFMAPTLARWIGGAAGVNEAAWCEARLVSRGPKSAPVDEYRPGQPGSPA